MKAIVLVNVYPFFGHEEVRSNNFNGQKAYAEYDMLSRSFPAVHIYEF